MMQVHKCKWNSASAKRRWHEMTINMKYRCIKLHIIKEIHTTYIYIHNPYFEATKKSRKITIHYAKKTHQWRVQTTFSDAEKTRHLCCVTDVMIWVTRNRYMRHCFDNTSDTLCLHASLIW
jgi:alpha-tubulin suppressor-like RCC1 family protein